MRCHDCDWPATIDDNFCRHCGASLRIIEVPVVRQEARSLTAWEEARPAVSQGIAILAAGALLRWVLSRAGRAAISRAVGAGEDSLDARRIVPLLSGRGNRRDAAEVEVFWYRRIRR